MSKGKFKHSYFYNLKEGIRTSLKGLQISIRHILQARKRRNQAYVNQDEYFELKTGMVTLRYPIESLPLPDNGRYRLHNEMDDCIVCDKCAKICPVDCITIEPIRATEQIGETSDGSPIRLYAAVFDIDMAKCCYCGLCTTVCPTECLTMTKTYDYSEFDITNMNYHFSNLSPEQAEKKRKLLEIFQKEKEDLQKNKASQEQEQSEDKVKTTPIVKPQMKPVMKGKPVIKPKGDA